MLWSDIAVRPFIVPGILAICSIYLGFRVIDLDRRVELLMRERGARPSAATAAEDPLGGEAPAAAAGTPAALEARLAAIEDDLAQVQEDYAGLDQQLARAAPKEGTADEARILEVVTRAQARVRDRQIEFHQANWRKMRSDALGQFKIDHKLEAYQSDGLQDLLDEEADAMVEILVRPDTAENPAKAAADWQQRLDETDVEATRLLDPKQREAWMGARLYERAVLWPWLPRK